MYSIRTVAVRKTTLFDLVDAGTAQMVISGASQLVAAISRMQEAPLGARLYSVLMLIESTVYSHCKYTMSTIDQIRSTSLASFSLSSA